MKYKIINGDILNVKEVDVVVNPANPFMSKGGGLCGAIHAAAGFDFTMYCVKQGRLKVGECKTTPGFDLPYKSVIHVLTPMYHKTKAPEEDLIQCFYNVFKEAASNDVKKLATPLLGGGHHFYPEKIAMKCAITAMESYKNDRLEVMLVLK